MKAMILENQNQHLKLKTVLVPQPREGQVLIKLIACGICRTGQHVTDGELTQPKLPLIPRYEIIGRVAAIAI